MALDRLPQRLVDRKEPVRRTGTPKTLMYTPVVVVLDPVVDPLARFLERLEPRPREELVLQRLPEPLDLPQRHGMMRGAADVVDMVPLQLLLELRAPPPAGILPAVVREHLPGCPVGRYRLAVDLHHVGTGLAAVHSKARDIPGVIIDEPDDVRRLPQDGIVSDVALPHLVGRRALEPARRRLRLPPGLRRWRRQPRLLQVLAYRLRTGLEAEEPPQDLRDPHRPLPRIRLLELRDLLMDRRGKFRPSTLAGCSLLQPLLTVLPVQFDPPVDRLVRNPQLPADSLPGNPLFQVQLHRPTLELIGIALLAIRIAAPHRPLRASRIYCFRIKSGKPPKQILLLRLLRSCLNLRTHW